MSSHRALLALAAAGMLAACGRMPATLPQTVPASAAAPAVATPPPCFRQRTTKKYGNKTVTLKTQGGGFCVPSFGGFGGNVQYPGVERAVALTIRTSTSNIYNEPLLGSGAPVVYLNLHFHAGTHFGTSFASKGGLTGAGLQAGDPYTAFGIVAVGHLVLMFPPCYSTATSGRYGGVFPDMGALFSGTTITGNGFGVIEIYEGEQTDTQCTAGSPRKAPARLG